MQGTFPANPSEIVGTKRDSDGKLTIVFFGEELLGDRQVEDSLEIVKKVKIIMIQFPKLFVKIEIKIAIFVFISQKKTIRRFFQRNPQKLPVLSYNRSWMKPYQNRETN